mmetsp:Transcript_67004/g.106548  ORF Transcript_67004/g.106548 Transcript_67004/m.106548 type:complete len:410 (+) Transcript_67004:62-1291(+)
MVILSVHYGLGLDILTYILFQVLMTIIMVTIQFHAINKLFCHPNHRQQSIQISTFCSVLSYTNCCIFLLIWDLLTIFPPRHSINTLIFGDIAIAFDCCGRILFQITFIVRLHTSFQDTQWAFGKHSIYALYIAAITLLLPAAGLLIDGIRWYSTILFLVLDCMLSISMSACFLYKLYKFMYNRTLNVLPSPSTLSNTNVFSMVDVAEHKPQTVAVPEPETESKQAEHKTISLESEPSKQSSSIPVKSDSVAVAVPIEQKQAEKPAAEPSTMSDAVLSSSGSMESGGMDKHSGIERLISDQALREYDLVTLMTKYSLLVSIAYCSSLLSIMIIFLLRRDVELSIYENAKYIEHLIISVNVFINVLCLYLSYAFNQDSYKIVCKCGHSLFNRCCVYCISRKLKYDITTDRQ